MRIPPTRLLPVLAVLLAAGLAGCAAAEPAGAPAASAPGTTTAPAPTRPPEAPAPKAPATQPDTDPGTAVRVVATGRVLAGSGPGCPLLATDHGRTWLLVGGDPAVLTAGARVRVVGAPGGARAGGCRRGEPLRVVAAAPA